MIKYSILLWWGCLLVIDASPVAAPDTRDVPDLQSACTSMDIWSWSEVAKALCGAAGCYENCGVGTCIKSQGRPVCSCSFRTPGAGGSIDCALSGKKWTQLPSKRKQRLRFKKVSFQFFLLFTPIFSSRIWNQSWISQTSLSEKDDLSSWTLSKEKRRRTHSIKNLVSLIPGQDYF